MDRKRAIALCGVVILVVLFFRFVSGKKEIEWNEDDGFRWAELDAPSSKRAGFKSIDFKKTGVNFINDVDDDAIRRNEHLLNGSGVTTGDVDGDGLVDIYFCGLGTDNVLYKNLGRWKFENITDRAGVAHSGNYSTGAVFADMDGDSDMDLLVSTLGGVNTCYFNNGNGVFDRKEVFLRGYGSTSLAVADVDLDGDLDVYVVNYKKVPARNIFRSEDLNISNTVEKTNGKYRLKPPYDEHFFISVENDRLSRYEIGEQDLLFLNDGSGELLLSQESIPAGKDWGLAARFQDMDLDGDPDLYVCNDFWSEDYVWINNGSGKFSQIEPLAVRSTSSSSMSVDFSDLDRDGDIDYFVTDMLSRSHTRRKTQMGLMSPTILQIGAIEDRPQYMRNTMFVNRGDNTFAEIGQYSGVQASEWSWSTVFMDIDLDGFEDLFISTGHLADVQDSDTQMKLFNLERLGLKKDSPGILMYPKLDLRNIIFRNNGDLTFEEVGESWGFVDEDISHGVATADLDNDGDLDLVVNRLRKKAGIYENITGQPRIAVRLRGLSPNTNGIGAKVSLISGGMVQTKEITAGGGYLSGSDPRVSFAALDDETELEVQWTRTKKTVIEGIRQNRIYEVYETNLEKEIQKNARIRSTRFKDVSDILAHEHREDEYNDFFRQRLLPNRLSQLGPGIAWYDLDADADDDLLITNGKGSSLTWFENNNGKSFIGRDNEIPHTTLNLEQSSVLGVAMEDGLKCILVAYSNYESPSGQPSLIRLYGFSEGKFVLKQEINFGASSIGPMSLADYDGDGDLDLFAGGRVFPGEYPRPASSKFYFNSGDKFILDEHNSKAVSKIGLVSGSVFSDIDNDDDPDLILALEWGPVLIMENDNGKFFNASKQWGTMEYTGWWNGVTTGDFNADGKLDIVATNRGLNSKYKASPDNPRLVYYEDFNKDGMLDIVEAHYDEEIGDIVPERGFSCISNAMPSIRDEVKTFRRFANSNLETVLGIDLEQATMTSVSHLEHAVFINRGTHFEVVPLPKEAQWSPAFHVDVSDINMDGYDDLFLGQNFFAQQSETGRSDAGRGMWLLGDGQGSFTMLPGHKSGVKVYGEQRGGGLCDFDNDGKIDLLITQNGALSKLFKNVGKEFGIRVSLIGSRGNPKGIGAKLWLHYRDGNGPIREIHAGSGYWSQSSATQIFRTSNTVEHVKVIWPDGKETIKNIDSSVGSVTINYY